ncbi:MAG: helix-turn-helix transcriptional regulator [Chloroflexi bacterium]|nr:helix-turn-helix transcriptional regulator [Chloroflexota bacterium]
MSDHPLKRLWERLRRALRSDSPSRRSFNLDQELVQTVQGLADREQRAPEDVAADLLSLGLFHRSASSDLWQRWNALSPREQQVAALICMNLTNNEIAARLAISPETVKTHVRNILFKFGLHSKAELRLILSDWDFSAWYHLLY